MEEDSLFAEDCSADDFERGAPAVAPAGCFAPELTRLTGTGLAALDRTGVMVSSFSSCTSTTVAAV